MRRMEYDDDDRSIRRIALRILNDHEDSSREILDNLIYSVEDSINPIKRPNDGLVIAIYYVTIFSVLLSIESIGHSKTISNTIMIVSFFLSMLPIIALWVWSRFQYGKGKLRKPRAAFYGEATSETAEALDKLFAYLQRDSTKAYYRRQNGEKRYLDPNFSYGPQRVLLLSASPTVRGFYLLPGAIRIKSPIKVDADPETIVKIINVKTKRQAGSGTYAKYPYEDAAIGLIGDPRLFQLDLSERDTAIQSITGWIVEWFKANPDVAGDAPRADYPRARNCAGKIYAHLKKISRS